MKKLILSIAAAALLWFLMFSPWTAPHLNFWTAMGFSGTILIIISALAAGRSFRDQFALRLTDIAIGLFSAVVLWFVFFAGDHISSILFDFAKPQVGSIYMMKGGTDPVLLSLLLAFLIGPAEEIFWRGYIQRSFIARYGEWPALVITTAVYALVHIWSFNFMLVMAAMVCGAFWGLMYRYNKNLVTVIISHSVWDVAVFILFPIL